LDRWTALQADGEPPTPALQQAVDAVFDARIGDIGGPRKLGGDMREIWLMQPRFDRRTPSSAHGLASQPRFRAGYDFLRLRADTGEVAVELAEWWEDFHLGSDEDREALLADVRATQQPKVRRVPGLKAATAPARVPAPVDIDTSAPVAAGGADDFDAGKTGDDSEDGDVAAPARKRRRRRRRPAGDAGLADGTERPDDGPDMSPPPRID